MTKPMGGLGRGLGALIPQKIAPEPASEAGQMAAGLEILEVSPDQIVENPHQPRKQFTEQELNDLVASIREHGVLQPLVVTRSGGGFELIAGERRLRASRIAGLQKVPVVVREAATDQQKLELALIENIQRSDLNAVEEALAYQSLTDLFSLTNAQVAERVGKSVSHVINTIRLLGLDQEILDALMAGKIKRSHARTLLMEPDLEKRMSLFREILTGHVTVREVEARAGSESRAKRVKDPNIAAIEAKLRETFGTKVEIKMHDSRGSVSIAFYSKEDFKRLLRRLVEGV